MPKQLSVDEQVAALFRGEDVPRETPDDEGSSPPNQDAANGSPTDPAASPGGDPSPLDREEGEQPTSLEVEDEGETPAAPTTLQALAERAGIDIADLYEMELELGDERSPIKLGDAKDQVQNGMRYEQERESFEDDKREFENQRMVATQELSTALGALSNLIGEDQLREIMGRASETISKQQESNLNQLAAAVPEWGDPDIAQLRRGEITQALARRGGNESLMLQLRNHPVLMKALHDLAIYDARMERANVAGKEVRKVARGSRPKANAKQPSAINKLMEQAKGGTEQDKVAAVKAMLNGVK